MAELRSFADAARIFADELGAGIVDGAGTLLQGLSPATKLGDFMQVAFGLKPARHHQKWIDVLEDPEQYPRVLIVVPPGHAKTTVAGVAYPIWKIGQNINAHFLYYGNTQTQAEKQSTAIRDMMLSEAVQKIYPHIKRSRSKGWAGHQWFLERTQVWDKDPTMLALGVDGPGLGARADEIIFDDVCDPQNMNTQESRRKVREQVAAVAFSRQGGKSRKANRMVAVMTRWHEDDLASFFEDEGFYTIWMPAQGYWEFVEPNEPIRLADLPERQDITARLEEGGALWDEEYDLSFFDSFKKYPDIWTLEYQGLAVRPGGNLYEPDLFLGWSRDAKATTRLNPYNIRGVFQFWDTAGKAKASSDYWVCETWAWATDGFYMLDVYQGRHDFPDGVEKMRQLKARVFPIEDDNGQVVFLSVRQIYVESTGTNNGAAAVQSLQLGKDRISASEITPVESKEERAGKAVLVMREKPCYFSLDAAAYTGTTRTEFLAQHLAFPRSKHDDMADVTAQALRHLNQYPILPGEEWRQALKLNDALRKDRVKSTSMMTKAGGSQGRIRKGMFSGVRRNFSNTGGEHD